MSPFSYGEMTSRNIGFVTEEEQEKLRGGRIFLPGVGGMGGAVLQTLVRAGVGHFTVADIDSFEVSNLNRQVGATLSTVGRNKAEASAEMAKAINPNVSIEVLGSGWTEHISDLVSEHDIAVNGTDDVQATLALMREAESQGARVIDAYAASLPSVYSVGPGDPRPEERMGYPSVGRPIWELSGQDISLCIRKEIEWVLTHSSSRRHIDLRIAAEFAAGRRSRPSFAPMVITTGNLMAYEALAFLTGRPTRTDHRGWFLNPFDGRVERPLPSPLAQAKGFVVSRFLGNLLG